MPRVLITQTLRVLRKFGPGNGLCHSDKVIPAGTEIEVGSPEVCSYDHGLISAVPLILDCKLYYILERDYDPSYWASSGISLTTPSPLSVN
jgi:hypothetical protein